MYTTTWCGDCRMAKSTLDRAGIDYQEIDIDDDPSAAETVLAINGGYRSVPTILLPDGRVLVEPSRQALLSAIGVEDGTNPPQEGMRTVVPFDAHAYRAGITDCGTCTQPWLAYPPSSDPGPNALSGSSGSVCRK